VKFEAEGYHVDIAGEQQTGKLGLCETNEARFSATGSNDALLELKTATKCWKKFCGLLIGVESIRVIIQLMLVSGS